MSKVIKVENLGKKYIISHQDQRSYLTLRETIANKSKRLVNLITKKSKVIPKREKFWALRNINLEVNKGERVGIIGRNGAGKTTLLKLLSRITEPSEGKIKIKGRVASLLEVGTGFHPELTGRENIFLNGAILGMSKIDIKKKFDEIVDFAEAEKFLDTPVKRYSSGMLVRLAFAVAAHLEAEILLIDEVLAVGDAQYQKKSLSKMENVTNEGRTVLFVSHNMSSVSRLCKRCIWISEGNIKEDDCSEKVIFDYLNLSKENNGQVFWDPKNYVPGDREYVYFTSLKIVNSKGTNTGTVFAEEPFWIEIEYRVLKRINVSQIGFKLNASTGEILFTSGDYDLSSTRVVVRSPGFYRSRCKIPGYLLNQGVHTITLYGHIPGFKILVDEEHVIRFEVLKKYNIGGYGRQPGLMRPKLQWDVVSLN